MISVVALSSAYAPTVAPAPTVARATAPSMMDLSGLKDQAKKLNPVVGYFDPLNLAEGEFWGDSTEATIGWLRESEIKHGRIAMFGFVGFIVHANGLRTPFESLASGRRRTRTWASSLSGCVGSPPPASRGTRWSARPTGSGPGRARRVRREKRRRSGPEGRRLLLFLLALLVISLGC